METFPHYWPFVQGIHRPRWNPLTKASDAELRCLVNSREAGDLRRYLAHYDVTLMYSVTVGETGICGARMSEWGPIVRVCMIHNVAAPEMWDCENEPLCCVANPSGSYAAHMMFTWDKGC